MAVIQTAEVFTPAELPRITDVDRADLTTGITHLLSRKGYISLTGATKLGKTTFVRGYLASLPEGSWSTYIPGQSLKNGATDLWLRLAQELEIHVPRLGPGRPRTRPDAIIADRAYTSGVTRTELRRRGIRAVIPEKSDQIAARKRRGHRGGRPPGFDAAAYRGRNVVERSFALAKQWRGLATRYDKLAITYRAAVTISAILTWLRHIGDTP